MDSGGYRDVARSDIRDGDGSGDGTGGGAGRRRLIGARDYDAEIPPAEGEPPSEGDDVHEVPHDGGGGRGGDPNTNGSVDSRRRSRRHGRRRRRRHRGHRDAEDAAVEYGEAGAAAGEGTGEVTVQGEEQTRGEEDGAADDVSGDGSRGRRWHKKKSKGKKGVDTKVLAVADSFAGEYGLDDVVRDALGETLLAVVDKFVQSAAKQKEKVKELEKANAAQYMALEDARSQFVTMAAAGGHQEVGSSASGPALEASLARARAENKSLRSRVETLSARVERFKVSTRDGGARTDDAALEALREKNAETHAALQAAKEQTASLMRKLGEGHIRMQKAQERHEAEVRTLRAQLEQVRAGSTATETAGRDAGAAERKSEPDGLPSALRDPPSSGMAPTDALVETYDGSSGDSDEDGVGDPEGEAGKPHPPPRSGVSTAEDKETAGDASGAAAGVGSPTPVSARTEAFLASLEAKHKTNSAASHTSPAPSPAPGRVPAGSGRRLSATPGTTPRRARSGSKESGGSPLRSGRKTMSMKDAVTAVIQSQRAVRRIAPHLRSPETPGSPAKREKTPRDLRIEAARASLEAAAAAAEEAEARKAQEAAMKRKVRVVAPHRRRSSVDGVAVAAAVLARLRQSPATTPVLGAAPPPRGTTPTGTKLHDGTFLRVADPGSSFEERRARPGQQRASGSLSTQPRHSPGRTGPLSSPPRKPGSARLGGYALAASAASQMSLAAHRVLVAVELTRQFEELRAERYAEKAARSIAPASTKSRLHFVHDVAISTEEVRAADRRRILASPSALDAAGDSRGAADGDSSAGAAARDAAAAAHDAEVAGGEGTGDSSTDSALDADAEAKGAEGPVEEDVFSAPAEAAAPGEASSAAAAAAAAEVVPPPPTFGVTSAVEPVPPVPPVADSAGAATGGGAGDGPTASSGHKPEYDDLPPEVAALLAADSDSDDEVPIQPVTEAGVGGATQPPASDSGLSESLASSFTAPLLRSRLDAAALKGALDDSDSDSDV